MRADNELHKHAEDTTPRIIDRRADYYAKREGTIDVTDPNETLPPDYQAWLDSEGDWWVQQDKAANKEAF